jgi:hypothetical protein
MKSYRLEEIKIGPRNCKCRWMFAIATIVVLLLSAGCHRSGLAPVTGKVTVDGTPLADGTISFESVDRLQPTAGGVIKNGTYTVSMTTGPKIVRIQGFKVVGQRPLNPSDPHGPMTPLKKQILPEKYNAKSTLRLDVGPAGVEKSFELTSKG